MESFVHDTLDIPHSNKIITIISLTILAKILHLHKLIDKQTLDTPHCSDFIK